jgi:hypothetical protein
VRGRRGGLGDGRLVFEPFFGSRLVDDSTEWEDPWGAVYLFVQKPFSNELKLRRSCNNVTVLQ